jgi:hypothetical protein
LAYPTTPALGAHLVGSVPLGSAEEVFRAVSATLGPYLARIPDGETGERTNWIAWQYGVLARCPQLEPVPIGDRGYLRKQLVQLRKDGNQEVRFDNLGYADAALASYRVFARLRREGVIPQQCRFQVSLPTPLAPMTVFVKFEDRATVEPAYEARLLAELDVILGSIPHSDLAIQWDTAVEMAHIEGVWPAHFTDGLIGIYDRLVRIGNRVPLDVELGYHLCYGDFGHRHFMPPANAEKLVRLANVLGARVGRPLQWIHLAFPVGWTQPGPVSPLSRLDLPQGTQVFLGVVHFADGVPGAQRRVDLAGRFLPSFGVATECGWGRRPPQTIPELMRIHAAVARPIR